MKIKHLITLSVLLTLMTFGALPKAIDQNGKTLKKQGEFTFTYYGFKVYTIGYYSEKPARNFADALKDRDKSLILEYHRKLKGSDCAKNAEYILDKNPNVDPRKFRSKIDELHEHYYDLKKGDQYRISYTPDKGIELYLNKKKLGKAIPGADFQKAYLSIWLSEKHSVSKKLTRTILGL